MAVFFCGNCGHAFQRKGREKECCVSCRFWAKVRKQDGCWEWHASIFKATGYGQFALTSTQPETAHRMAWVLTHGYIPDGKYVLHKCDNRKCCNPDHLFLGTPQDNMIDMVAKGRHVGTRNHQFSEQIKKARSRRTKLAWESAKAKGVSRPCSEHYA
jgi:hypothetical protein